jgi:hypothetical protein
VYAVCYAETNGGVGDATWRDSYLRVKISKVQGISSTLSTSHILSTVTHYTDGQISNSKVNPVTYVGTLAGSKYISLVDNTLNNEFPCDDGAIAAATADTSHSGPLNATASKVAAIDTTTLNAALVYSVCYTEGDGTTTASWIDSGLRITLPHLHSITYGSPARVMTSTYSALSVLPQETFSIEYTGLLAAGSWLSLVKEALNSLNPCVLPAIADAANDNIHSGSHRAFLGGKQVRFDHSVGLNISNTYALCYAVDTPRVVDRVWYDSFIRVTISKVTSTSSESITHTTTGHIASGTAIDISYAGSLSVNKWISLIDATINNNYPCLLGSEAASAGTTSLSWASITDRSGPLQAQASTKLISFSTRFMNQVHTFAVCYSSSATGTTSATWADTGIRLTISKVNALYYGDQGTLSLARHIGLTLSATSRLPQEEMSVEYMCDYCISPLGTGKYISIVAYEIEGNNDPCASGSVAAAVADEHRSGSRFAPTGSRLVSFPERRNMALGRLFTVCYAEVNGATSDVTWRASYLKFEMSKITSITVSDSWISGGFSHVTYGQIPSNTLTVEYVGTLPTGMWISFVDATLAANEPCGSGLQAATQLDSKHSGSLRGHSIAAGDLEDDKIVTLEAYKLDPSTPFAVCYSDQGQVSSPWYDSAIRITVPKLTTISYGVAPHTPRIISCVPKPTDKIPRVRNMLITYDGVLGTDRYISFVDATLNSNKPCNDPAIAAAVAGVYHSGSLLTQSGTRDIYLPQVPLLDPKTTFAVCYCEGNGTSADLTWADSYVRFQVSHIENITAHAVEHRTWGHIAYFPELLLTYGGSLRNSSWISLVDQTLNSNYPCADKAIPIASPDAAHSGLVQADNGTTFLTMDTTFLSGNLVYALCYSWNYGHYANKSHDELHWFDSGIRLTVSKVQYLTYGYPTVTFTSSLTAKGLPQAENVPFLYYGDLGIERYFSIVDSTFNAGNPCGSGAVAAGYNDNYHSGSLRAYPGSRKIVIPQNSPATLLNETRKFAVCYAEIDGTDLDTTWRDSYIRVTLSRIESIIVQKVTHRTVGQIPNNAKLQVTYTGSVPEGRYISLVDQTLGLVPNYPCDDGPTAAAPHDALHSGPTQAGPNDKIVTWNTTKMNMDSTYIVCYSERGGTTTDNWLDSGIRITLPKLNFITYSDPMRRMDTTFGSQNKFPRVPNAKFSFDNVLFEFSTAYQGSHYIPYTMDHQPYDSGCYNAIGTSSKLALLDVSINNFNPCEFGSDAAAPADTLHSGVLSSPTGTYEVTVPQQILLDATKTFALCYTEGNGATNDLGWRDSYIRLEITEIERVTAHLVSHTTSGHVANSPALVMFYTGSLVNRAFVSLVQESVNNYNPCTNDTVAGLRHGSWLSTGSARAGLTDTTFSADTSQCDTAATYAVCYAATGSFDYVGNTVATWVDSAIRLTIASVKEITYLSDIGSTQRIRRMDSSNVPSTFNRLPQKRDIYLTYWGTLPASNMVAIVDVTLNANDPCAAQSIPKAPADASHSGPMLAGITHEHPSVVGNKTVLLPQDPLLNPDKQFAVCYGEFRSTWPARATFFPTHLHVIYRDSYIRVRMSKISAIESLKVSHNSLAHLASLTDLTVTYTGSLLGRTWITLVEENLNNNFPCQVGTVAAAAADSLHTGVATETGPAANSTFVVNTTAMDTSKTFALCYSEGWFYRLTNCTVYNMSIFNQSWINQFAPACYNDTYLVGNGSATWIDSGLRATFSELTALRYGEPIRDAADPKQPARHLETANVPWTFNVFPQVPNVVLLYIGSLLGGKYLSFVDSTLNAYNPCALPSIAAATADSTHSGAIQGTAGTKYITVPQSTLLDETVTFAVCYANWNGTTADSTWRDSYMRVRTSMIESINAGSAQQNSAVHKTTGHLANYASLALTYTGSLGPNKWISFVQAGAHSASIPAATGTFAHDDYPCADNTYVAAPADSTHSGVMQSSASKVVSMNSTGMNTTLTYSLCYTDAGGDAAASWIDSGIRVTIAKVTSISYWALEARVIVSSNRMTALHVLPQVPNVRLLYDGVLAEHMWISLVDKTTNSGNPCYFAADAGHAASTNHSGPMRGAATDLSLPGTNLLAANNNRTVVVPQTILLDYMKTFAVCYAEVDGTNTDITWRDSYIRARITKLESIAAHKVTHRTTGHLANFALLAITYEGSLANNKWFSLVDQTRNSNFPCAHPGEAAMSVDNAHSGPLRGGTDDKLVIFDTTGLQASMTFAVCYTDFGGTTSDDWYDSAVRVTVGTVIQISYLSTRIANSANVPSTWAILPRAKNIKITYGGILTHGKFLSFVDVSLNRNNPCGSGPVAAAPADSLHSGSVQAAQFTKTVTLPQLNNTYLDYTKTFTVCYALNDGSETDSSWRDSYIRIRMSQVEAVVTTQVSHRTSGHIGNNAKLAMTYVGTLPNNKWLALVDDSRDSYPCRNSSLVAGQPASFRTGPLQAGLTNKYVWLDTTALTNNLRYAVCYTDVGGTNQSTWVDAAIRLTISTLNRMTYVSGLGSTQRIRIMEATDLPSTFNILPQIPNLVLTYAGPIGPDKFLSFVDVTINDYDPCTDGTEAAHTADHQHSGTLSATEYTFTLPQSTFLAPLLQFAVCYASNDGTATDSTWHDSYIRFKMSEVHTIEAHLVRHSSLGHLAAYNNLAVTYHGTLPNGAYLSMVRETLNDKSHINPTLGSYPCGDASIASAPTDSQHSGSSKASSSTKVSFVDTSQFDASYVYAICYTMQFGNASADWTDTALRITTSKVNQVHYGTPARYIWPKNIIDLYHVVPQAAEVKVFYYGGLGIGKWLSLVDRSLNSYSPCVRGIDAAHVTDSAHSGPVQGNTFAAFASFATQQLNFTTTFAMCYAEVDGTTTDMTWRDSYIRVKVSQVRAIISHSVTHITWGQLGNANAVLLTVAGTLPASNWISLVDEQKNSLEPCAVTNEASHSADLQHSGVLQTSASKSIIYDTTPLNSSLIFAVCYTFDNNMWHDSALRLTVGTVTTITYAPEATYVVPRVMTSLIPANSPLIGGRTTLDIIPQHPNIKLEYGGELAAGMFISLVSLDLFPYNTDNGPVNPCVVGAVAAATADSLHSGPLKAANGTKVVTIPQATLLSQSKTFAVCYAKRDGTQTDPTWRDTYVRTQMSMVESVAAQSVVHRTKGHIAAFTGLSVTYTGNLGNTKWLSFVDASLNNNYPCSVAGKVGLSASYSRSGSLQAGANDKIVTIISTAMNTSLTYAVCYTDAGGDTSATWIDSALRITISKISGLRYDYGRYMREFTSTNNPDASYVIAQTPNIVMTYVGELGTDKWVSVVADHLNTDDPCVAGNVAAATADVYHSGPIKPLGAHVGTKAFKIPQTTALLDVNSQFAFCYAEGDGTTSDIWHDSYIRMKISKLYKIVVKKVSHTTWGHIDAAPNLPITTHGGLSPSSFLSLVEKNLNLLDPNDVYSAVPCAPSSASLSADSLHSGPAQASNYTAITDTSGMDTSKQYAVCYSEGDGTSSDITWKDSGIRVTLSRLNMITYGDPFRTFTSSSFGNARLLPSAPTIQFTYSGILPVGSKLALVHEVISNHNPCMDGIHGELESVGVAATPLGTNYSGVGTTAAGRIATLQTNSLDPLDVYALCYTEGDGSSTDALWRDSYMRITMQRIKTLSAAGVAVNTYGTFPFADKLEVIYEGRLDQTMWLSFVVQHANGGEPCLDSNVAAHAKDTNHSGSFRAGFGNKIVYPFVTAGLFAQAEYAVCYAEVSGDSSDTWVDTGFRLRFFGWTNPSQNRFVSAARPTLSFRKNEGIVQGDLIAILPEDSQTTCADAPSAYGVTDGTKTTLFLTSEAKIQFPVVPLNPGYYFMCYCSLNGYGGTRCRNSNGGYARIAPGSFKLIDRPRLGNITSPGDIRAITGLGHAYYIKGGVSTAFVINNGDKIFFAPSCDTIPTAASASTTVPLSITNYDTITKAGYFTLPAAAGTPLKANGNSIRTLVACFSTKEAVTGLVPEVPGDYTVLDDVLNISPLPRLGALQAPGNIIAVSRATSSFRLHNFFPGDFFFFGLDCTTGVSVQSSVHTTTATGLLRGVYDSSTSSAMFDLPGTLEADGETRRDVKCCMAPARSDITNTANWYELTDTLTMIPHPIKNLVLSWKRASVDLLDFSGPTGHAAQEGDIVLLQKDNCDNAHVLSALSPNIGITHSAPMTLEAGARAFTFGLAQGKVNELPVGTYAICFATASSEYDTLSDFKKLDASLTLTPTVTVSPTLVVPDSVHLGVDIVVIWNSTDGQYTRDSVPGSWLGLYRKGECNDASEWAHKCYLVAHELPSGETGGVVRFPQQEYKAAGEYEVRYFRGNSRSGQGQVCAGLRDSGTGTYLQCALQVAARSETIHVFGSIESQEDMGSIPGLEHVVLV